MAFLSLSANSQTEITDTTFEEKTFKNDDKLVVVDFYATWCGPCKIMDPILKELAEEYEGEVSFYKFDIDKNELDDALGLTSVPTYFFIKNTEALDAVEGSMSKEKFIELIEEYRVPNSPTSILDADNEFEHGEALEFDDIRIEKIWENASELNSLAWHAYLEHEDISSLLIGLDIVKRSIELEENYHNVDTYAALLYKTGRYDDAFNKAKEAIDIAKRDDLDYSSTSELIGEIAKKL